MLAALSLVDLWLSMECLCLMPWRRLHERIHALRHWCLPDFHMRTSASISASHHHRLLLFHQHCQCLCLDSFSWTMQHCKLAMWHLLDRIGQNAWFSYAMLFISAKNAACLKLGTLHEKMLQTTCTTLATSELGKANVNVVARTFSWISCFHSDA